VHKFPGKKKEPSQNPRLQKGIKKFHTDDPIILDTTVKISRQGDLTTGIYAHLVQRIVHPVVCLTTGP